MTRHSKREIADAIDELEPETTDRQRPPELTDEDARALDDLFGPTPGESFHGTGSEEHRNEELYERLDEIGPLEWRDEA